MDWKSKFTDVVGKATKVMNTAKDKVVQAVPKKTKAKPKEKPVVEVKKETPPVKEEKKVMTVHAPFTGKVVLLKDVPDPVFAEKMMGDGVAVMPESKQTTVMSFVGGEVTVAFPTGHAYTVKTACNRGVLLHVGLETVALNGEGFERKADVGTKVTTETELGTVNFPLLEEKKVKSLVSPVILLTDAELEGGTVQLKVEDGQAVKAGDVLFEVV